MADMQRLTFWPFFGSLSPQNNFSAAVRVTQKTANLRRDLNRVDAPSGAAWCILSKGLRSPSVWVRQVRAFSFRSLWKGIVGFFVKNECLNCGGAIEFDVLQLGEEKTAKINCPHCSLETTLTDRHAALQPFASASLPYQNMLKNQAHIITKRQFAGIETVLQLIGFILIFFVFPAGLLIGLVLMIVGARIAKG